MVRGNSVLGEIWVTKLSKPILGKTVGQLGVWEQCPTSSLHTYLELIPFIVISFVLQNLPSFTEFIRILMST